MPLRLARVHDLSAITDIYAAAFYDEEFMGALMHPKRRTYPQDYRRYWENKVAEWYWDYSHQMVVTYIIKQQSNTKKEEVITGVGDWIRHGSNWERHWKIWGKWDPRNLIRRVILLSHRIALYWHPNRAADSATQNLPATMMSCIRHLWSGTRSAGWYLNFLAVDLAYQKQGYGRLLVQWGVEQSKQENVTASVISGSGKDRFYRSCGFEVLGGHASDGEGNPTHGKTEGGSVLFRDPLPGKI